MCSEAITRVQGCTASALAPVAASPATSSENCPTEQLAETTEPVVEAMRAIAPSDSPLQVALRNLEEQGVCNGLEGETSPGGDPGGLLAELRCYPEKRKDTFCNLCDALGGLTPRLAATTADGWRRTYAALHLLHRLVELEPSLVSEVGQHAPGLRGQLEHLGDGFEHPSDRRVTLVVRQKAHVLLTQLFGHFMSGASSSTSLPLAIRSGHGRGGSVGGGTRRLPTSDRLISGFVRVHRDDASTDSSSSSPSRLAGHDCPSTVGTGVASSSSPSVSVGQAAMSAENIVPSTAVEGDARTLRGGASGSRSSWQSLCFGSANLGNLCGSASGARDPGGRDGARGSIYVAFPGARAASCLFGAMSSGCLAASPTNASSTSDTASTSCLGYGGWGVCAVIPADSCSEGEEDGGGNATVAGSQSLAVSSDAGGPVTPAISAASTRTPPMGPAAPTSAHSTTPCTSAIPSICVEAYSDDRSVGRSVTSAATNATSVAAC